MGSPPEGSGRFLELATQQTRRSKPNGQRRPHSGRQEPGFSLSPAQVLGGMWAAVEMTSLIAAGKLLVPGG